MIPRLHLFFIFCLVPLSLKAETYSYPDLVNRMTDMQQLARLPAPGEKTFLASSYDRASQYDAARDKYLAWGANADGTGIIRKEGDASVFVDVKGPGCIWRIWSADAGAGHVKIYLDGAGTPAVDIPFSSYFDGKTAPFNRPNLVYVPSPLARGFDNYTPISFQKSCKIVADEGWGKYYHFTYTQFPSGTVVPTFSMNLSQSDSAALDRADKILAQCGHDPAGASPDTRTSTTQITAQPGKTTMVADFSGAGAITALKVKLDLPADAEEQRVLLRRLTISIAWDDEAAPAVWSPLGDFFAYVGGAEKFQSFPVGLLKDGTFYSYWYMPYGKKAHIEIGNDGPNAVTMTWQISRAPLTQPISNFARFHAKWHRDAFPPQRRDRAPDWTLLMTQGRGRYVGTHLHIWNPRGDWWGEGDDKFFVDGEKFPSTFGTGSEDYFGYAWGSDAYFSRPYHNQILTERPQGHIDDNRWHVSDSVPFQTSFEGAIEKYFQNDRPTLYAAEAFWYLSADGTDPYAPAPVTDRVGYWIRPQVYHEPGAIEAETLRRVKKPVGAVNNEAMFRAGKGWSDDHQLLWNAHQVGETLELLLPAQKAGGYTLEVRYTKAPNYGIFQASLEGVNVGQPVDNYAPALAPGATIELGHVALPEGKPVLTMTLTGKDAASHGTDFGFDFLKLVPESPGLGSR